MLEQPLHYFKRQLPKDPLTGECQFVCSVAQTALLDASLSSLDAFARTLAPKRRAELVRTAREGLGLMSRGFTPGHVLVQRALALAQAAVPDSPEVLEPTAQ